MQGRKPDFPHSQRKIFLLAQGSIHQNILNIKHLYLELWAHTDQTRNKPTYVLNPRSQSQVDTALNSVLTQNIDTDTLYLLPTS